MDGSAISLVSVIHLVYSQIATIHCWAMGAGIRCARMWMVISYELYSVMKMFVCMASLGIYSVVPINFFQKVITFVRYWMTILSDHGREAVNFRRTYMQPSFVAALWSQSLSASHISTGSSMSSMSGRR